MSNIRIQINCFCINKQILHFILKSACVVGYNTAKESKENMNRQNKKSWSDRHEERKGALALFRSIHNQPTAYVKVNGRPGRLYIRDILLNFAFTLYTPPIYIQSYNVPATFFKTRVDLTNSLLKGLFDSNGFDL